jgi:hypothetical protein
MSCRFLAEWLWQYLLLGFRFGTVSAPLLGLDLLGISLVIVLGETLHKLTWHHMVAWLSESS